MLDLRELLEDYAQDIDPDALPLVKAIAHVPALGVGAQPELVREVAVAPRFPRSATTRGLVIHSECASTRTSTPP